MKERPILFSGEMVRAILDGRKTQTRRAIVPEPRECNGTGRWSWCASSTDRGSVGQWAFREADEHGATWTERGRERTLWSRRCPYGQPGDLLWVREAHRLWVPDTEWSCRYRADGDVRHGLAGWDEGPQYLSPEDAGCDTEPSRWRPSIHMPRWASRLTLRVVDVRVERVQEIDEADALAEGIKPISVAAGDPDNSWRTPFSGLWDRINGKRCPWDSNPWVWAVTFEVVP